MAKKKRKRKPKPYINAGSKKMTEETPQEMRKKYPKELVDAFVSVSDLGWSEGEMYDKYKTAASAFLGDKIKDRIESGRLIVQLSRATADLRKKEQKNVEKKIEKITKKATDKNPQLDSPECMVSSVGPNEEQKIQAEQKVEERI